MKKILICTALMVVALMAGGCSSNNFMVYKNGSNFYVTSDCPELKQILCYSGDIDSIMKDSNLPGSLQVELKDGICTSGKSSKHLVATLEGMTNGQITALKDAFRRNGYEINRTLDA
ncbi:MAG: hypothetical protein PHR66_13235 [Desulfuromonadaceae bacterium]|nr:hypothetical protein [Desulfuromonadaceae bacterium]